MPFQIVPPGTHIDFIGKWRIFAAASVALIVAGIAMAPFGLRWGIDFAGGTEMQIRLEQSTSGDAARIREVVQETGVQDPTVVPFGELGDLREYLIRFSGLPEGDDEGQGEIVDRLQAALVESLGPIVVDRVEFVGPRVGAELREAGAKAMLFAAILILIYITFRFSARFAPGALVALLHDVLITCSIWILLGQEFNLQVLAALLAIIGYSLNDTIIVYDRIRENMELRTTRDLPEVLNASVNQTLSRTILTSATTLVAVLSLLIVGGEVIRPFAMAMTIGIVVGTYSSIFIASPTLLVLEQRFGSAPSTETSGGGKKPPTKKGDKRSKGAARA